MNEERIDIRDLALMLGPGNHDMSGRTVFICDGNGRELEFLIEDGALDVKDNGFVKETQ